MAALLATRFTHKAAELFAYKASIVQLSGTFTTAVGSPTTAASGVRPCPRRTLTGLSRMHASITRLSRAAPGPSLAALFASKKTTPPRRAPAIPNTPGSVGSQSQRSPPPQSLNAPRQGAPRSLLSAAGGTTMAAANRLQRLAATLTNVPTVVAPTLACTALSVGKGRSSARGRFPLAPLPNPRTRTDTQSAGRRGTMPVPSKR